MIIENCTRPVLLRNKLQSTDVVRGLCGGYQFILLTIVSQMHSSLLNQPCLDVLLKQGFNKMEFIIQG